MIFYPCHRVMTNRGYAKMKVEVSTKNEDEILSISAEKIDTGFKVEYKICVDAFLKGEEDKFVNSQYLIMNKSEFNKLAESLIFLRDIE